MGIHQITGTAALSAAVLFIIAKLMGHKEIAQLDFFDYLSGITIGSIAAELATELETPWKPLCAMLVYGAIALGLDALTSRFAKTRKYVNGTPTILFDKGKLYREKLKMAKLNLSDFLMLCRQAGFFRLADIQTAVFESNGKLSILPCSGSRPATPADMALTPPQEELCTEVIMDGRILDENLRRLGLDVNWLQKQLTAQGYHSAKDVLLGLCDPAHQLSLYAIKH